MANENLDLDVDMGPNGPSDSNNNKNNNSDKHKDNNSDSDAKETRSNALILKYKQMANTRRDYEDIDIKDCIPTLDEMVQDDLMYEVLEKVANGDTEKDTQTG